MLEGVTVLQIQFVIFCPARLLLKGKGPVLLQGVATQQALARARAMLSGWTGPTAQPPVKTTPVPPSLEVQTVAANTCPGVLPDHETRLPEERTAEVQNWSEQSPGLAACEGHVPEEELRFSCGGPETQLALAKGRAVVRKWAPGLVSPVSGKGVGVERNVGGGRNESKGSENVTAKQEETDLGGGDAKETSRREGDGSGERAGKESERRWGVQGGAGAEGGECSEETRVQLDVRVDAGPSRGELGQAEGVEQQRGLADGGTAATRERLNGAREEESRVAVGEGSGPPKVGPANFAADRVGEVATDSIQVDERLEHAHGVAANNSEPGVGRNLSDAFVNTANKDGKDPQQLPAAAETLPEDDVALTSASRAEPQQPGSLAGDGQMEEAEAGGIRGDTERAEGTPPDGLGDFTTPPVMLGPFWAPEGGFPLGSTAPPSSGKRPCALWRVSETQNPDETPVRNGPTEEHVGSAGSPQGVPASLREGGFVENGPEGVGGLRAGLAAGLEGSATSKPDEVGARMVATEVIGNLGEPSKPSETRAAVDANGWRQKVTEARAPPEGLKGSGQTVPDCREDCPKLSGDPPAGKAQLSEPQPVTNEKAPRGSPKGAGWTQCLEYFQQQVEMGRVCTLPAYSPGGCVPMEKTGGVARRVESEPSPQKVANVPNEKVTAGGGEKTGEQFAKGKQGDELERGGVGGQLRVQEGGCGENEETGSLTVDDDVAGGWRKAVRAGGEQTRDGVPAEKEETHRNGGLGAVCAAAETNRHEKGGMDQALPSAPQHGAASPGGHGLQRSCSQSATPWPEICSVIGSEELPLFKPKPRVVYSAATKPAGEGGSVEDNEKEGGREEKSFVEVETQESVGVLIWQRRTGVKRARTFVIDSASEGREAERGGIHTEGEDALQGDVGNGGNGARKRLRKVGGVLLEDIEEEATWHHVEAATWHEVGERKGGGATKGIEAIASRWLGGWTPAVRH